MKWKSLVMVCLLVLFLLASSGSLLAESSLDQYWTLQKQYEQKLSQLNQLVVMSQKDIMEWSEQLPVLVQEAKQLKVELQELSKEATSLLNEATLLKKDLVVLVSQLDQAKKDMDLLLESLANSEILLKLLEKQLKAQIWKTNLGLGLGIVSLLGLTSKIVYDYIKSQKE